MTKVTDATYDDLASQVIFTGKIKLLGSGLWLRPGKSFQDLAVEAEKALKSPPFKTEEHAQKIADAIRKLTTTKQPKCVAIPD